MNYSTKIELEHIANAITSISWFDWSMFIFNAINVIAFVWLTILIYKLNKKQVENTMKFQKDNLKQQLFNKRYSVYEAIENTVAIMTRKDYSQLLLSGEITSHMPNKNLIDAQEKLHKASRLSQTLFRPEIYKKIYQIENKYTDIVNEAFRLLKLIISQESEEKPNELQTYGRIFKKQLLETNPEKIDQLNNEMQEKCPNIYKAIIGYNLKSTEYITFVIESNVLEDFDEDMIIDRIDK